MPHYRDALPQLNGQTVLTDGGFETVMIFQRGVDLPDFCSFPLVRDEAGPRLIGEYLDDYAKVARRHGVPLLLESVTWRAHKDWVERLGMNVADIGDINREAIDLLVAYRQANPDLETLISGCVGPRGDGYVPGAAMSPEEATEYHAEQIAALASTEADLISALTLNYVEEAIGVATAASDAGIPCALSFTVETDGRLPTGQPLGEAIQQVDEVTGSAPAYYMINCAHPTHFEEILQSDQPWTSRLRGLRSNASTKSHAELDEMTMLDEGDPEDLGRRTKDLRDQQPQLSVIGGCCGTDHRHLAAMAEACLGDG